MLCKFKSINNPAKEFTGRVLFVQDEYAMVQDDKDGRPVGTPRHVALKRLERRSPTFWNPSQPNEPRTA